MTDVLAIAATMLGGGLLVAVILYALYAWVHIVLSALPMIRGIRPGVAMWSWRTGFNPFNVLFLPSLLTEEGLRHRRDVGVYTLKFALPIGATLVIGHFLGLVK